MILIKDNHIDFAGSLAEARAVGRQIANSPLVKTAWAGCDPNWGRVIAAAGRSGCALQEQRVSMKLCGRAMFARGTPLDFDAAALSRLMHAKEITLEVDLGLGRGACTFLTCDYSYDYVKINAEYTT